MTKTPSTLDFGTIKRLLISGATGFIGAQLTRAALAAGCSVTVISRQPEKAVKLFGHAVQAVASCDALNDGDQFDAIVHLAGANVFALPWFRGRKNTLLRSRLELADALLAFVQRAKTPPAVWLSASAVGFYPIPGGAAPADAATTTQTVFTETADAGTGFAAELCQAVEARVAQAASYGVRAAALRFGLVLGRTGGVFPQILLATRFGGGAVVGRGTQRVAWVHIDDAVGTIAFALADARCAGPINVVAPQSPTYRSFIEEIARAAHRPTPWRVPALVLKLALGERAPLLLEGAQISPAKLAELNFGFQFPELKSAALQLLSS
jgi:uncharacterized protein